MLANLILSVLAGVMLAASFPLSVTPGGAQFCWPLLAYIGPVLLFVALRGARCAWHAYILAFIAGVVFDTLGVYWISSFGALALGSLGVYQAFIFGFLGIALHLVL